ncbi:MAG: hypothetical protein PW844_11990 [Pantoea sp.]|uniref:hypothetical protein n=1 Tax=Pantoea sp. TaxID=69393 RepID=UPI0023833818|nr:hypothetical protein [Pantoea sp.]MDE1187181.1 hypothetical protein [Pantoea sp.]
MKRIFMFVLVFMVCCVAISKAIAVLMPIDAVYSLANALHIFGDESVLDFMIYANVGISIVLSAVFSWLVIRHIH